MDYEEFKEVLNFIDRDMSFYFFDDFIKDAKIIKKLYKKLDIYGVKLYRMYVYSHRDIHINKINGIWSYLNNDLTLEQLMLYNK